MNFELNNRNLGNWLSQLNGKTVNKIFQVDYNNHRREDIYLPWLFFITFTDFEKLLKIEGDFDGSHIRIDLEDISLLEQRFEENNFPNDPDLWRVYLTSPEEKLYRFSGQKINFIEYGIDKDEFVINGTITKGQKDVFSFIKFHCEELSFIIFEGSTTGLDISNDSNLKIGFEKTFEVFNTNKNYR